jgi:hypothetical protein
MNDMKDKNTSERSEVKETINKYEANQKQIRRNSEGIQKEIIKKHKET